MKAKYCPFCRQVPKPQMMGEEWLVIHICPTLDLEFRVELGKWNVRQSPERQRYEAEQMELGLKVPIRSPKQRQNDLLICALAKAERGMEVSTVVGPDARRHASALATIRQHDPSAEITPQLIADRALAYRKRWPRVDLTSTALAKWWSVLGATPARASHEVAKMRLEQVYGA